MIKHAGFFALALGIALVPVPPAGAFTWQLARSSSSGNWYPARWAEGIAKVRFVASDTTLGVLPNLTSDSNPIDAIQAAMQTWAIAPTQFYLDGTTSRTDGGKDGVNLITMADTPKNRDVVADANAVSLIFYGSRRSSQHYWPIVEADVVFTAARNWATTGDPDSNDLQAILTHELGHCLGLDHSPIIGATMYYATGMGQTNQRVLETDDIAAMRALYNIPAPDRGAIAGKVVTATGDPVFGAHVVAADANGLVTVGQMSDKDGSFTLPSLPAGSYAVYAEPLVGEMTAKNLGSYYHDTQTDFRTTVAGTDIRVTAGETTTLDPTTVSTQAPSFYPKLIGLTPDGNNLYCSSGPAALAPGDSGFLAAAGPGVDTITAIGVPGNDIDLDPSNASWGNLADSDNTPYVMLPFSVSPRAQPGSHSLLLFTDNEMEAYTGGLVVMAQ